MDIVGAIKSVFGAIGTFFQWLTNPFRQQRKEQAESEEVRKEVDDALAKSDIDELNEINKRLHRE